MSADNAPISSAYGNEYALKRKKKPGQRKDPAYWDRKYTIPKGRGFGKIGCSGKPRQVSITQYLAEQAEQTGNSQ